MSIAQNSKILASDVSNPVGSFIFNSISDRVIPTTYYHAVKYYPKILTFANGLLVSATTVSAKNGSSVKFNP